MIVTHAIFLGILQGLTEFLPVSSSGHLVLVEHALDLALNQQVLQSFDVALHSGTLLALIFVYAKMWRRVLLSPFTRERRDLNLLKLLFVGSLPAAAIGILLHDVIAEIFRSQQTVGMALVATGLILIVGEYVSSQRTMKRMNTPHALAIGFAQALALLPGISRAGWTISMGRMLGLTREQALDFSFLLATPAIFGATLLSLPDLLDAQAVLPLNTVLLGFLAAFLSSLLAIAFLKKWVRSQSLAWFALYLIPIGGWIAFL